MSEQVEISINIRNNRQYPVTVNVMGSPVNTLDTSNAKTEYRWDVTGFDFSLQNEISIFYKPITAAIFSTFSFSIPQPSSIDNTIYALNKLGIGYFNYYVELGSTYISTYNDEYVFGDLNIFNNSQPSPVTTTTTSTTTTAAPTTTTTSTTTTVAPSPTTTTTSTTTTAAPTTTTTSTTTTVAPVTTTTTSTTTTEPVTTTTTSTTTTEPVTTTTTSTTTTVAPVTTTTTSTTTTEPVTTTTTSTTTTEPVTTTTTSTTTTAAPVPVTAAFGNYYLDLSDYYVTADVNVASAVTVDTVFEVVVTTTGAGNVTVYVTILNGQTTGSGQTFLGVTNPVSVTSACINSCDNPAVTFVGFSC